MISRASRIRFVVFLLVAAVGTSIVGSQYVGLDRVLWNRPYTVTLTMQSTGGIFENAEVTYRGVAVGRVRSLDLVDGGVSVSLAVDRGERVPADVEAVVANRSAIGEQFVDLQPLSSGPPWLEDGANITADRVAVPPRLEEVLLEVKDLTDSVDQPALQTLVAELGDGFNGIGPELQGIIDHTDGLLRSLDGALPATRIALDQGRTVLQTQKDTSRELIGWSRDLSKLTRSLANADGSVRSLIDNSAATLPAVERLVLDNDQQLPLLMRDLVTVGDIVRARLPGVRVFLVAFPRLIQDTFNVVQGDGYVHFNLVLDYSSGGCTSSGYSTTAKSPQAKPVPELGNPGKRANLNAYCAEEPGSISAVRGSQNVPRLPGDTYDPSKRPVDNPRRGQLGPDVIPPRSYETAGGPSPSSIAVGAATFDPRTGVVRTALGPVAVLGDSGRLFQQDSSTAWKWLLLGPIFKGGRQ